MNKKRTLLRLITIYLIPFGTALAQEQSMLQGSIVTLSAGPAWYHAGKTQTLALQPELTNTYVARVTNEVLASGELFLGLQRPISPLFFGQLGLAVATSSYARLQGSIWETADPTFDNFTYQYNLSHTHLAIKGKLLSDRLNDTVSPYVSASLGVGFNRSYQFSMTPTIFEVVPQPLFQSHTQISFVYTLGTGIQKSLNQHWRIGIGYEFSNWGNSHLAAAPGQTINQSLELSHLYTNQLQCNISYLS